MHREQSDMDDILFETPENPIPPHHSAGYFKGYDGTRLRYALFRNESGLARGTVILLHGRNECIEKYFETIADLNAAGLWVATFDWRGQGGSDRLMSAQRPGHVDSFLDYQHDLSRFIDDVVLPDARLPFFVLAHSMGGLIALSSATHIQNRIERMVVTAPFVGLARQKAPQWLIALMARSACLLGFGKKQLSKDLGTRPFEGNPLTSDPARFARYAALCDAHPQLALGPPTARWLSEMFTAIRNVNRPNYLSSIMIPTIVLAATADPIVPFQTVERLSQYFRAGQLIPINGARHEIFQERDLYRHQALAATLAFIPGSDAEDINIGTVF
jgi:lysophospholipase